MKKIRKMLEKCAPFLLSITITYLLYYFNIVENNSKGKDISFIFSTTALALLITHKSIILATDKQKHNGFKKLLSSTGLTKRFFSYLNNAIYFSIVVILYNFCCEFKTFSYTGYLTLFLTVWLILQVIRFIMIFNIVFEKSINS